MIEPNFLQTHSTLTWSRFLLQEVKISLEILLILRGLPILLTRTEEIESENDEPSTILSKRMGRPNEQSWMLLNMSFVYLHTTAVGIWYTLFASCPCQMPNCPPFVDCHSIANCVLKSEFALHAGRVQGIFIGHESDLLLPLSLGDGLTRENCCFFGFCPNEGGGRPCPNFWHIFRSAFLVN